MGLWTEEHHDQEGRHKRNRCGQLGAGDQLGQRCDSPCATPDCGSEVCRGRPAGAGAPRVVAVPHVHAQVDAHRLRGQRLDLLPERLIEQRLQPGPSGHAPGFLEGDVFKLKRG